MASNHNFNSATVNQSTPPQTTQDAPLVSVLIRSGDRVFLSQALDSVALQTYPNLEVVVLAVRSGHRAIGDHCGKFPMRLVPTDRPIMRSAAANQAMTAARGEFLIFLDDDDWMMPGHISRLAEVLVRMPQSHAVYTGIGLVDAEGKTMGQIFDLPFDPIRQLSGNLMPIHAVLFRSRLMGLGCRFDETLDRLEDWDFWLQVAKLSPMVHLPGVSAIYRIHDSSGVHQDPGPQGAANQRIYQKWEQNWTSQQIGQIMQRVWTHQEMETRLDDALWQKSFAEQRLVACQPVLAEQMACITRQASIIAQQTLTLAQQQLDVNALTQKLDAVRDLLAHSEREKQAILSSRVWRMTQPLRATGASLKKVTTAGRVGSALQGPGTLIKYGLLSLVKHIRPNSPAARSQQLDYRAWTKAHDTLSAKDCDRLRDTMSAWQCSPLISVLMPVFNPPLDLLEAAISSIQAQIYPHWELCIADDASTNPHVWRALERLVKTDSRIKAVRRPTNGHISQASNSALELVCGEFIALMDNDDLIPPDALYWVAEAVNQCPTAKIIYSDEDRLDAQGERYGPYFKSDWNYTLFLGHNMVSHLGVFNTQLVRGLGGFRQGFEGSQDYDLVLRCIETIDPSQIVHIPKVLYHWRAVEGSTALSIDSKSYALGAAQRALQEHLVRVGSSAIVEQLPSLDYKCVRSHEGARSGLTVVLVCPDGHSPDGMSLEWTKDPAFKVSEVLVCGTQGASVNRAIASACSSLVALIDASLRPSGPEALLELIGHALESPTGTAAGAVRSQSGLLVAGGLILNQSTIGSVLHKNLPSENHGYAGRAFLSQELSAVCLDCAVFRKSVFTECGGFDTDLGIDLLGAVAWGLRLHEKGYRTVWCPEATWTTYERPSILSKRGFNSKRKVFLNRYGALSAKWLLRDPAYHPRLNPVAADFSFLAQ